MKMKDVILISLDGDINELAEALFSISKLECVVKIYSTIGLEKYKFISNYEVIHLEREEIVCKIAKRNFIKRFFTENSNPMLFICAGWKEYLQTKTKLEEEGLHEWSDFQWGRTIGKKMVILNMNCVAPLSA